ncbi:PAS domain-containing protein [Streptomyces sp. H10-C2]|uniref:hybrid sensor histidine kinase/response regulator n=1 Tax=unclassified Streptomyces TaxID=2593676 RepID=UPI0024BBE185|nr:MULTISPECIES: PAS domain-containing protein [unclassified Streptomyces]MDJ0342102.1 PAS domain-containing protein [Streptomyces sp. PH10-H1]MDJ0368444.1 PAS domain-containing protein [Streptomyces sp. H10-C2]
MSSRPSRGAARLASILDALPDALLLVNCNGTVVNANAIAIETFESPGTALVGRGLLDLLPAFDSKRIPGSMRSAQSTGDDKGRTKPTRMVARRTDGSEFPVEVTSANLEDGRTPYDEPQSYTGDELLMLVVRDLSGTMDTEAELARQQRQTEMILRAAAEGVVGVDTEGKVVLVNPSAAQILGYRATDLGGQELHPLAHHTRADGTPLPYEETPLADTLRSGRKHRVRGQVLWRKDGRAVPVDLTTAPVRDGEQLVGAVMTFTDRSAYDAVVARSEQLQAVLDEALRGPLAELRGELTGLAADPAGQLWPEANQILHHLVAGYARITTLIDNVLAFQRLDRGEDRLRREPVGLDKVVAAGVDGAIELIGPGRAQYAVHAPPIEAAIDGERMSQALAHLIADVAGVDAAGNATVVSGGGDSTIVVAAAQRGDVIRIDVRGPHAGGNAVHLPIARGIVERHGGVLQTHEVPGQGSAYVLEVPLGSSAIAAAGRAAAAAKDGARESETTVMPMPAKPARGTSGARGPGGTGNAGGAGNTGGKGAAATPPAGSVGSSAGATGTASAAGRKGPGTPAAGTPADGASAAGWAGSGEPGVAGTTRAPRPRRAGDDGGTVVAPWAIPTAGPDEQDETRGRSQGHSQAQPGEPETPTGRRRALRRPMPDGESTGDTAGGAGAADLLPADQPGRPGQQPGQQPSGRRARRPLSEGQQPAAELPAAPVQHALPVSGWQPMPQEPQQPQQPQPGSDGNGASLAGQEPSAGRRARRITPPQPEDTNGNGNGNGPVSVPVPHQGGHQEQNAVRPAGADGSDPSATPGPQQPVSPQWPDAGRPVTPAAPTAPTAPAVEPGAQPQAQAQGLSQGIPVQGQRTPTTPPGGAPQAHSQNQSQSQQQGQSQGRAISVRTLGQGVAFVQPVQPQPPIHPQSQPQPEAFPQQNPSGSGRRRKLNGPQQDESQELEARPHPLADPDSGQLPVSRPPAADPQQSISQGNEQHQDHDQQTALLRTVVPGRAFAIGAPAEGAEGPEPLDGPNGAVEVTEDPSETGIPLPEPRRLLVWPEPDVSTRQALTDRGYRPVIVRSREEVDAQVAEPPAALFVDPLTGPITRTALKSLRQAAAEAEVPVLVTAGLGQATREAAYGADPAVLLKALAPRDSEQHPPRVLLVESHQDIAQAFTATLERRGMQVAHASSEVEAMTTAAQVRPNLVVMDLMLVRRRRQGIVDWLRSNGQLNRTPLVVYTSADIDPSELPRLASGETVLFLAERSTSTDVQSRIVDLLGKIGAWPGTPGRS